MWRRRRRRRRRRQSWLPGRGWCCPDGEARCCRPGRVLTLGLSREQARPPGSYPRPSPHSYPQERLPRSTARDGSGRRRPGSGSRSCGGGAEGMSRSCGGSWGAWGASRPPRQTCSGLVRVRVRVRVGVGVRVRVRVRVSPNPNPNPNHGLSAEAHEAARGVDSSGGALSSRYAGTRGSKR